MNTSQKKHIAAVEVLAEKSKAFKYAKHRLDTQHDRVMKANASAAILPHTCPNKIRLAVLADDRKQTNRLSRFLSLHQLALDAKTEALSLEVAAASEVKATEDARKEALNALEQTVSELSSSTPVDEKALKKAQDELQKAAEAHMEDDDEYGQRLKSLAGDYTLMLKSL